MKKLILSALALALPASAVAQTSTVRIIGRSSDGIDRPVLTTTDGKLQVDSGAASGGGATVPTGPAGTPNSSVVTVQGISGGTPQSVTVTNPTAQGLTDTQLRASAVPVSGPLTDTQLRAAAVPTTVTSTPGLTDAQLRATPVPVAGTATVTGNVATATADAGNPVKIGCVYNTSFPVLTAGQRGDCQANVTGAINVATVIQGTAADGVNNANYGVLTRRDSNAGVNLGVMPLVFNGTTWDRNPGNTAGSFVITKGSATLLTGQVSVGTTATLISAARTGRGRITVNVLAANSCAFGGSTVTLTTGYQLQPVAGASTPFESAAALYAVCSATTNISYWEN